MKNRRWTPVGLEGLGEDFLDGNSPTGETAELIAEIHGFCETIGEFWLDGDDLAERLEDEMVFVLWI